MTDENQGAETGVETGADEATVDATNEATKEANQGDDTVNLELEKLKKEISERDKKIFEYSKKDKERADLELSSKSDKEKLAVYEAELRTLKQQQEFAKAGLDSSEWDNVLKIKDFSEQAKAISSLLNEQIEKASAKKLEAFKNEQLSKVDKTINIKQTNQDSVEAMLAEQGLL